MARACPRCARGFPPTRGEGRKSTASLPCKVHGYADCNFAKQANAAHKMCTLANSARCGASAAGTAPTRTSSHTHTHTHCNYTRPNASTLSLRAELERARAMRAMPSRLSASSTPAPHSPSRRSLAARSQPAARRRVPKVLPAARIAALDNVSQCPTLTALLRAHCPMVDVWPGVARTRCLQRPCTSQITRIELQRQKQSHKGRGLVGSARAPVSGRSLDRPRPAKAESLDRPPAGGARRRSST